MGHAATMFLDLATRSWPPPMDSLGHGIFVYVASRIALDTPRIPDMLLPIDEILQQGILCSQI
jgi:hypothetical protein